MKKLISILILSAVLVFNGFLGLQIYELKNQTEEFGKTIPTVVALFETSLQSSVSSSATSMTLVKGTDKRGTSLSGTMGFVIDEGTSSEEFVLCSVSATALTSCQRGIDVQDGETEVTALKFEHRRGGSIKITNYPQLAILSRILNAQESVPNKLFYPSAQDFTVASSSVLVDKNYVDTGILAGCADGSLTVKGCSELATVAEIDAGTGLGGTGARLFVNPSYLASSTYGTQLPSSGQKAALAGSSGTPGAGNLYITADDVSSAGASGKIVRATGTALPALSAANLTNFPFSAWDFGGDGTDGALNTTSGTVNIDLANAKFVIKNYTSITVVSNNLTFSNPASSGTVIVLKSQGAVTVSATINAANMGADGAVIGGTASTSWTYAKTSTGTGAGAGQAAGSIQYLGYVPGIPFMANPGSGGGGGANSTNAIGAAGGRGGGGIVIESGGALNFTGTITVAGQVGSVGGDASANGGGGGGGGAGGSVLIMYNSLTSEAGTVTVIGGAGGQGGDSTGAGAGTAGAGGGGGGSTISAGGAGGNASTAGTAATIGGAGGARGGNDIDGGGGGGGGSGWYMIIPYIDPSST